MKTSSLISAISTVGLLLSTIVHGKGNDKNDDHHFSKISTKWHKNEDSVVPYVSYGITTLCSGPCETEENQKAILEAFHQRFHTTDWKVKGLTSLDFSLTTVGPDRFFNSTNKNIFPPDSYPFVETCGDDAVYGFLQIIPNYYGNDKHIEALPFDEFVRFLVDLGTTLQGPNIGPNTICGVYCSASFPGIYDKGNSEGGSGSGSGDGCYSAGSVEGLGEPIYNETFAYRSDVVYPPFKNVESIQLSFVDAPKTPDSVESICENFVGQIQSSRINELSEKIDIRCYASDLQEVEVPFDLDEECSYFWGAIITLSYNDDVTTEELQLVKGAILGVSGRCPSLPFGFGKTYAYPLEKFAQLNSCKTRYSYLLNQKMIKKNSKDKSTMNDKSSLREAKDSLYKCIENEHKDDPAFMKFSKKEKKDFSKNQFKSYKKQNKSKSNTKSKKSITSDNED